MTDYPPCPVQLGMCDQIALWGYFWSDLLQRTFSYARGSLGPRMADPVFEANELKLCLVGPAKVFLQEALSVRKRPAEAQMFRLPVVGLTPVALSFCHGGPHPHFVLVVSAGLEQRRVLVEKGVQMKRGDGSLGGRGELTSDVKAERRSLQELPGNRT